jgi:hypothetical protein
VRSGKILSSTNKQKTYKKLAEMCGVSDGQRAGKLQSGSYPEHNRNVNELNAIPSIINFRVS